MNDAFALEIFLLKNEKQIRGLENSNEGMGEEDDPVTEERLNRRKICDIARKK